MKHIIITTIAAMLLVGCGESQQSTPAPEAKPVEPVDEVPSQPSPPAVEAKPVKPVVEATKPKPPTTTAPAISIWDDAAQGNIEAVKQHLADGADVNAKNVSGRTPLHCAADARHKEIAELLIAAGADVNAKKFSGGTPLRYAATFGHKEIAELLLAEGADVNAKDVDVTTPLDLANLFNQPETADLLRKHGGKTAKELEAEGK